jgi:hypothetical protein
MKVRQSSVALSAQCTSSTTRPFDGRLGHRHVGEPRLRIAGLAGGDDDDGPGADGDHGGADRPGRYHHRPQLRQHGLFQYVLGHLEEGSPRGPDDAGRVEDEHVDRPQGRGRVGHQPVDGLRVGDIGAERHRAAACGTDVLRYAGGGPIVAMVVHRDRGAQAGQQPGGRRPDPVAGAGHERDPPGEQERIFFHADVRGRALMRACRFAASGPTSGSERRRAAAIHKLAGRPR